MEVQGNAFLLVTGTATISRALPTKRIGGHEQVTSCLDDDVLKIAVLCECALASMDRRGQAILPVQTTHNPKVTRAIPGKLANPKEL